MSKRKELFKYFDYLYDEGRRHNYCYTNGCKECLSSDERFLLTTLILRHEPRWHLERSEYDTDDVEQLMVAVGDYMMSLLSFEKDVREEGEVILHETIRTNLPHIFRHKINAMFDLKHTDITESREDNNYEQWKERRIEAAKAEIVNTESAA